MKVMKWLMALALCACAMIDVLQCRHHFKKSKKLASRESLEKKFKIMAHPQDRPDMMTVVMKGKDGPPGSPGQQGDAGKPGPQGPKGAQGDKGLPGVCSRTQCENEQLKSIIQRMLALEKYVNSKLNNSSSKNKSEGDTDSKACNKNLAGRGTSSPTLPPCPVASTLIAIMPLYPPAPPKAPQGNTKSKCQGQATNNARPSTGHGQGQGIAPTTGSPTLSGTTPAAAATTGKPSYAPCPTTSAATPAPTPTKSTSSNVFPSAPFYVTLQGVTSYDSAPMVVPPQPPQATVYGGPLNPFKAVPANWVTSGAGPIDLKPALYSQTQGQSTAQQNFVSPAWTMTKKNKVPSLHLGLLTHKLAAKKLSVSAAYMKSTKKSRKIIFHHHKITKSHYKTLIRKHIEKKTPEKNHQQLGTRKVMAKKTH